MAEVFPPGNRHSHGWEVVEAQHAYSPLHALHVDGGGVGEDAEEGKDEADSMLELWSEIEFVDVDATEEWVFVDEDDPVETFLIKVLSCWAACVRQT